MEGMFFWETSIEHSHFFENIFFLLFDHENQNIAQITLTVKDGLLVVKILLISFKIDHIYCLLCRCIQYTV